MSEVYTYRQFDISLFMIYNYLRVLFRFSCHNQVIGGIRIGLDRCLKITPGSFQDLICSYYRGCKSGSLDDSYGRPFVS